VIDAGKAVVLKVGTDEIRRLVQNQPDVAGDVEVTIVGDGGEVGASSGTELFDASYDSGQGRITRELVLRHAPASDGRFPEVVWIRQSLDGPDDRIRIRESNRSQTSMSSV
jgi:hypothetical protein